MLHSFIVISFGLLRFVVLYLFTGMVMTTTIVVILVTDMFFYKGHLSFHSLTSNFQENLNEP